MNGETADECLGVRALLRALACACVCVCVLVWRAWSRGCLGVCGGAALVCAAPPGVVCCGGFLLSHTPWGAVPLARPGLASRFGMLLGVSPVL